MKKLKIICWIFVIAGVVGWLWLNYTLPYKKYDIPVEKIYVINLDKSNDRLASISKQFQNFNLEFTRFPAVLGLDLKIQDENDHVFYGKDLKSGKEKFRIGEDYKVYCPNITLTYKWDPTMAVFGRSLTAGELGAYCSHVEVMFDVMKNRYKSVVVFEDDVVLPDDFVEQLHKIEHSMPNYKNYDMIFLGYNKVFSKRWLENKFKMKKIPFNSALEAVTSHRGLVGSVYASMYGYPGAERRLAYLQPRAGIDIDSFRLANLGLLKTFKARHINVDPGNMDSQISDMGRQQ